jgi:multidrug efflux pump subunit AcrB
VTAPQLYVEVDEPKALSMGIPLDAIYATLQATPASLYVNDFNRSGKTYKVQVQADAAYRMKPDDLLKPYVRSRHRRHGAPVGVATVKHHHRCRAGGALQRLRGRQGAGQVPLRATAPATPSRPWKKWLQGHAARGLRTEWVGQAFQEKRTGSASIIAFVFGIIMVFLILAAQYEKWSLPLAVIMAVPFAMLGALVAVLIRGMPNDIYFQIGLVVLLGLAAKNAILIVEFAAQKQAEGIGLGLRRSKRPACASGPS